MLKSAAELWTWDGGMYYMPHLWGSEAISYRTDLWKGDPAKLSYGSLWEEDVKGHTQGRGHSFLLGIGLWMDASGKMRPTACLTATRTKRASRSSGIRSSPSPSSARPGSSSSGIRPITPSRAS